MAERKLRGRVGAAAELVALRAMVDLVDRSVSTAEDTPRTPTLLPHERKSLDDVSSFWRPRLDAVRRAQGRHTRAEELALAAAEKEESPADGSRRVAIRQSEPNEKRSYTMKELRDALKAAKAALKEAEKTAKTAGKDVEAKQKAVDKAQAAIDKAVAAKS
jgi:multidrug resistance efflux pump